MLKNFWNDEAGAIISAELAIVLTIVVIGMVTGLSSLRDAVITELADVGAAIGSLNQSYTVAGVVAHSAATGPSTYSDLADFCDNGSNTSGARCLAINNGNGFVTAAAVAGSDGSNQ